MDAPKIKTAIPMRRFRLGDYEAVVLGEVESGDDHKYRFILALVRSGESKPGFYVTSEKNPRNRVHEGSHRLCVVSEAFSDELGSSDRWGELDDFAEEGMGIAVKVLGLGDVTPVRTM